MSLIPPESYYPLYINMCLVLVLLTVFHSRILNMNDQKNTIYTYTVGLLLLVFLILFMGQRPIHYLFGDTVNYIVGFTNYKYGTPLVEDSDLGWHLFMRFMAQHISIHTFYTIVCFLYIFPMYKISKQCFGNYWFYAFLMFVISFSFWTYGVNGIRNGAAGSLFLWGLCYRDRKWIMAIFFFIAISFHKSLFLPVLAFIITYFYDNPKVYIKGWLACIPLSLVLGSFWIGLFAGLGFGDDRFSDYLLTEADTRFFSSTGFRWDFLFHSSFAVFAGWYYIYKKNYKDKFYNQLLSTYLICNAFWILIIEANYSNRFAYLSWFLMAIVIIYPLLKAELVKRQHFFIGKIMLAYFSFTYLMYYVYYADYDPY